MTKSAMIRARMEPDLKKEGEGILKELGISTSEFLSMTYRQLIMRKGLPFDVRIPNDETVEAINEDLSNAKRYSGSSAFSDMVADATNEKD